jgi:hypothetical protein
MQMLRTIKKMPAAIIPHNPLAMKIIPQVIKKIGALMMVPHQRQSLKNSKASLNYQSSENPNYATIT